MVEEVNYAVPDIGYCMDYRGYYRMVSRRIIFR